MGRSRGLLAFLAFALCALGFSVASATAEAPQVTTPVVSDISYATAHVEGEVDPKGQFAEWFVDVSTNGTDWERSNVSGGGIEGSGLQGVEGDLEGLKPGTKYQVRLGAMNYEEFVQYYSPEPNPEFTTLSLDPPTVSVDPVSTFSGTSASFSGTINPNAPAGNPSAADVDWHFQCSPDCPQVSIASSPTPNPIPADSSDHAVSAEATDLEPNTTYEVTLVGKNAGDPIEAGPVSFKTATVAPSVTTLRAFPLEGANRALVGGRVNPRNSATKYWVEYGSGSSGAYSSSTEHADAGSGGNGQLVRQEIDGLDPSSTYHFRLVAESAEGVRTDGEDLVFTMPVPAPEPSGAECPNAEFRVGPSRDLPDCRAYELASPPDGQGLSAYPLLDVAAAAPIERWGAVSTDGSAVLWRTMVTPPSANGTGFWDYFVSSRATGSWQSTSLSPPSGTVGFRPPDTLFATPDLDRILLKTFNATIDPSDPDPIAADTHDDQFQDLYRFSADGTWARFNRGSIELSTGEGDPIFRASSEDLDNIVFTDPRQLEPGGSTGGPTEELGSIYWSNGDVTKVIGVGDPSSGKGGVAGVSADGSVVVLERGGTLSLWSAETGEGTDLLTLDSNLTVDSVSRDGTKIFFKTSAPVTGDDSDTSTDLYVYDTTTSEATLLSAPDGGGPLGNSDTCSTPLPEQSGCDVSPVIESRDGSQAYFLSPEQIVKGKGVEGGANLYRFAQGQVRFVATLDPVETPRFESYRKRKFRLTPDESKLIFESRAPLTGYDNAGHSEVYLFDPATDALVCASCRPDGEVPTADSELLQPHPVVKLEGVTGSANSDESGGRIFFSSRDAIVGGDVNGRNDVYEFDVTAGAAALISTGVGERDSIYLGNGIDGRDVYFITTETLESRDRNGAAYKVYDAREGGGFPPPPPPPPPCEADGCQGPQSTPPAGSVPGSAGFNGRGNPRQAHKKRCGKNARKVRRGGKARCVSKHQKKHHGEQRDAKHNRRAGR